MGAAPATMKGGMPPSIIVDRRPSWPFLPRFPGASRGYARGPQLDDNTRQSGGLLVARTPPFFQDLVALSWPKQSGLVSHNPGVDHVRSYPEPLNSTPASASFVPHQRARRPSSTCRGRRIETKGEIAHGSMPFLGGTCAVRHMGAVMHASRRNSFLLDSSRPRDAGGGAEGARGARP